MAGFPTDSETIKILDAIEARWLADQILRDWSQTNLGAIPNVYIGIYTNKPPPEAAYPLLAVSNISRVGRGSTRNYHEYALDIWAGVFNTEQIVTGTPGSGQSFKLRGFQLVEGLRDMAENAIFREGLNRRWKVDTSGETVSDAAGYFFKSFSAVQIEIIAGSMTPLAK